MEKVVPRTFRGTRDFLAAEMIRRERLFAYLREVYQRYGFSPLETPAIEYLDVLLGKYGAEGEKLIYPLAYKGGRVLALRYDLTVPLARVVAQHGDLPRPYKRYQMQPVWRADRPQLIQGRFREFWQCDADIVGEPDGIADAEILAVTAELLEGLGMGPFQVRVNHRKILEGLVRLSGLPPEAAPAVLRAIDKIDRVGREGLEEELEREGIEPAARSRILDFLDHPAGGREAIEALGSRHGGDAGLLEGCRKLLRIWDCLEAFEIPPERFEFRLTLARGLDYYTGAVFESVVDRLPHFGSVSGGGRFDGLVGVFSKEEVPAVGSSIGIDRVLAALDQLGASAAHESPTEVLVLQFGPEGERPALAMTGRLRREGLKTEVWYHPERLGKQIGQADKRAIPLVVFQGPDEAANNQWVVKVLETGEQETLPAERLAARLREHLARRSG